jgi:hypothetical protein
MIVFLLAILAGTIGGLLVAIWGLYILIRGKLTIDDVLVHRAGARLIGFAVLVLGVTFLVGALSLFAGSPRRPPSFMRTITANWQALLAGSFLTISGVISLTGIRRRNLAAAAVGVGTAVIGAIILLPSGFLESLVYRLTGDDRFRP